MGTLNYAVSLSGGGASISRSVPRTADGVASREVALPAGKPGTLSTRTDDDTGIATVSSGHGIVDTDTVDVYWSGGRRYGVDVTAVTSTTISLDAGAGDNLPIATTAVVVVKQVQVNADIDGDALEILGLEVAYADPSSTAKAQLSFHDADADLIVHVDANANVPQVWDVEGGSSNPFAGDPITQVFASNGSGTADATLRILWAADSTP